MNAYQRYRRRLNVFEKIIHATYPQLLLSWLLINAVFAAIYFALSLTLPTHAPSLPQELTIGERLFDSFYFSIVTATSTGYGDIVPLGFSKVLAMVQCIMALLVFAVLVGKLVSQRQDMTLHEVHRMTFEGVFYHIRHVLYIVRKDFDTLIQKVEQHIPFNDSDWDTLGTAYLQAHNLIEEIPEMYNGHGFDLQNINLDREKLLFESVHRTLQRAVTLIRTMDTAGIDWTRHEGSMKEFRRLIDMVDAILPLWNERSPYHEELEFEDIRTLSVQLHREMKDRTR